MGLRQTAGLRLAPVLFRLALGVTFIWAGHGKVLTKSAYSPDDLAALANMGVSAAVAAARPSAETATPPAAPSTTPPKSSDPDAPLPEPAKPSSSALASTSSVAGRRFTPAEFDANVNLAGLYRVALLLRSSAADPAEREDGSRPMRLWPKTLGESAWPARLAWAVALTELIAGSLVLVGFMAQFAALGLVGVMLGALWLATIGPAINAPKQFLFLLPELSAFQAWQSFALQMCALACAFGVACIGAGWLSVDSFVFGGSRSSGQAANSEDE